MKRRSWQLQVFFATATLGAAALVWLTYHPQSAVLDVGRWPWVGENLEPYLQPLADRLRKSYLQQSESQPPESELPSSGAGLQSKAAGFGAASPETGTAELATDDSKETQPARKLPSALPFEWLRAGAVLRRVPKPTAEVVFVAAQSSKVFLRERQGRWARVQISGHEGWIFLPSAVSNKPPLGRAPQAPLPQPGRPPEPRVLARALGFLPEVSEESLGPYRLYTDVDDPDLVRFLGTTAVQLEGTYEQRYGLRPKDRGRAAVVFYARREDYRDFQNSDIRLAGLDTSGHAGSGVVAFFREGTEWEELGGILAHEVTHLLNRRAIGPALPPWLNEGLAEDLRFSKIGTDGVLVPGSWSGTPAVSGDRRIFSGGRAALLTLRDQAWAGTLLPGRRLAALDWEAFVAEEHRNRNYAQAALWVRYLLDGDPTLAERFRVYLQAVALGGPVTPRSLRRALELSWPELDEGFRAWILAEATRLDA